MDFLLTILRHRPAVHQLCVGAFLQEHLRLAPSLWAVPLQPLGMQTEAEVTARYIVELLGAPVEQQPFDTLLSQGAQSRPLVALVHQSAVDGPEVELERLAAPHLERARMLVSWSAGERAEPFALVTARLERSYFRLLAPHSRRRQRLGFGNERDPHEEALHRLFAALESDERFAFAVSVFHEALVEQNASFRVARFFSCLEALTYRIRGAHGSKTRNAVRDLLGLNEGAAVTIDVNGRQVSFDRVEVAGRIRDKLFHGVPFDESELTEDAQVAYRHLIANPDQLRDMLLADCELAIIRWANGTSRGQR